MLLTFFQKQMGKSQLTVCVPFCLPSFPSSSFLYSGVAIDAMGSRFNSWDRVSRLFSDLGTKPRYSSVLCAIDPELMHKVLVVDDCWFRVLCRRDYWGSWSISVVKNERKRRRLAVSYSKSSEEDVPLAPLSCRGAATETIRACNGFTVPGSMMLKTEM
ncbi:hypothetical protein SAY86_005829 [Trapa natans]|uniref:Uncharacterized protein n=1 Tax=Trapa natans TaxID=22666 RepID=A0AAN7L9N8_TRANT|nr:hypothetical protein SAY86_005829 [Trapa natans]